MHSSLVVRTNILLLAVYAAAVIAWIWTSEGRDALLLMPFLVLGIAAGWLQSRVLRAIPQRFLLANSSIQIRRALWSVSKGKVSIALAWISGAGCVLLLLLNPFNSGFATALAAYATFGFARELVSLRSVAELTTASEGGEHAV
jgi:hypothetical protein